MNPYNTDDDKKQNSSHNNSYTSSHNTGHNSSHNSGFGPDLGVGMPVFATEQGARSSADDLGVDGTHSHEVGTGDRVHMPGARHDDTADAMRGGAFDMELDAFDSLDDDLDDLGGGLL